MTIPPRDADGTSQAMSSAHALRPIEGIYMPTRRSLVFLVILPACGDSVSPLLDSRSDAITNAVESAAFPSVGALVDHDVFCSGVLITPRLLATAAHCLDRPGRVLLGSQVGGDGSWYGVLGSLPHPMFDRDKATFDFGLLLLDRPAAESPVELVPAATPPVAGATVQVVGFGLTDVLRGPSIAIKRAGTASVASVTDTEIVLTSSPSQPCSGDSGGAVMASDHAGGRAIGIIAHGDLLCQKHAAAIRLDAVRDFVATAEARIVDQSVGCRYAKHDGDVNGWGAIVILCQMIRTRRRRLAAGR